MKVLFVGVMLSAAWAILGMGALLRWSKAFGKRQLFAVPAGDPAQGVRYAFTAGLAPGAKESVRLHALSYLAGLAFHAGVFTTFLHLGFRLAGLRCGPWLLGEVRALEALGVACGVGLLIKRVVAAQLRCLNTPDDYLSNVLCTVFMAMGLASTVRLSLEAGFLGAAMVLLVYAPLGKLRHSVFFFTTRAHFGAFFGRRGTLPPRS